MFKHVIAIIALTATLTVSPGKHQYNWLSKKEFKCLTDNIYYEARGESLEGQRMVAKVVLNRTKHPDYPDSICGVVYQPFQFSWTAHKQPKPLQQQYNIAKEAAYTAHQHPTQAIFFHNLKVKPHWSKTRTVVAKEGKHVFYD